MALTKITSDILADEFNSSNTLTAGATVNVDFKNAEVFTLTPNANIIHKLMGYSFVSYSFTSKLYCVKSAKA